MELDLRWVPRDPNEEADALTNFAFGGFREHLRQKVMLEDLQFEVFQGMLRVFPLIPARIVHSSI